MKDLAQQIHDVQTAVVNLYPKNELVSFNDREIDNQFGSQMLIVSRLKLHEVCRALFRLKTSYYRD